MDTLRTALARSPVLSFVALWLVCAFAGTWALLHLLPVVYGVTATVAGVTALGALALAACSLGGVLWSGEPWRGRAHTTVVTLASSWVLVFVLDLAFRAAVSLEQLVAMLVVAAPLGVAAPSAALIATARVMLAGRQTHHILYFMFNAYGVLLYIGITNSPRDRFDQHRLGTKTSPPKEWWPEVAWIEMTYWPSRAALEAAEKYAIQRLQPRENDVHNRVAKRPRRRSAYVAEVA